MEFAYIFVVCISLVLLTIVLFQAVRNFSAAGSKPFVWQIVFIIIWSVGSLMEMLSVSEQSMLMWRNIEQIGIFLLPVACVYFAVDYARYERIKKFLPLLLIIPVVAIVLIFTDSSTHIMRYGYIVSYNPLFGKALSVRQTSIGMVFVTYNYILAFISLVILYVFSRRISKNMRRQAILVLLATASIFLFGLFKTAFLEGTRVNIPIVTLYLPGGLILYYNLYKNNFFRVSPIARDKVFDVVEMGIVVTDSLGMIVDTNPFAGRILSSIFGIHVKLAGQKIDVIFGGYTPWMELIQNYTTGETEIEISSAILYHIHIKVYPLYSQQGTPVGSVTIMQDVTDLRKAESVLKTKAETDSMTGLLNKDSLMKEFAIRLKESIMSGTRISVLMMDLDKFKGINDTYGHDSGDRMLVAFSDVLKSVFRHEDVIARIGGDEFAAVISGVDKKEAMEISNRILMTASEKTVQFDAETSVSIAMSIGICDNEFSESATEMLKFADNAMYAAKNKLGNCCVTWE